MEKTSHTPDSYHMEIIRSQILELSNLMKSCKEDESGASHSDMEKLVNHCALDLEDKVKQTLAQSSVAAYLVPEDSSAYFGQLKEELHALEAEKIKALDQIEALRKSIMADSETMERDLEWLKWSVHHAELLGPEKVKTGACVDCFCRDNQLTSVNVDACQKFELLDLQSQIEKKNKVLKSLQSLDCKFKRYDIIEEIEDALSWIKVIEFDQNSIRLSLKTYVPKFEDSKQNVGNAFDTLQVNHELLIEVVDESLQLASVEMFPNDVYIVDIVDAAKSFRQASSTVLQTSLEWFLQKVQERIIISTLRRSAAKSASGLRYSAEYMEGDDSIMVHFAEGIDAILKASHGWPLCDSPFVLKRLKCLENGAERISLSFLHKVEEAAKSLEVEQRKNLPGFLNAIVAMLSEQ